MKKWEYYSERTTENDEIELGQFGMEGWELICVVPIINSIKDGKGYQDYRFYFKREIFEK